MATHKSSVIRLVVFLFPLVLSAAIAFGTAEATLLLARRELGNRLSFAGPDMLWLAPLGYAAIFSGVLIVGALLGLAWKRFPVSRLVPFAIGFLGTVGMLYSISDLRLHGLAVVVVAAGIGYQLSRMESWLTLNRRPIQLAGMLGATLVLAAWFRLDLGLGAGGQSASRTDRDQPNIVLLVWDTVRELNLSLYGYERPTTPFLERWAAQGVVFERAFSTSSWTLPAHASLFTGRFPHEVSADFEIPLDGTFPTLAEVLRGQGYRTGGFVANPHYTTNETGLARGFERWEDYRFSVKETLLSTGMMQQLLKAGSRWNLRRHDLKRASAVTSSFLNWLDRDNRRPFFAFLNYFDAHVPYYAPPEILRRFGTLEGNTGRYDAAIAGLDAELGRLVAALEARGLLDQTIVVVTSDHGEQFGGHGLYDHANSLYRELIQVPLVVVAPGRIPAGVRVSVPVSLRNVPATLLDLAGIPGQPLPGQTHTRFWRDSLVDVQDSPVLSELTPAPNAPPNHRNARGEIRSLVSGRYHYILGPNGFDELFDLRSDPHEARSLKSRRHLPVLASLWSRLRPFDYGFPRKLRGGALEDGASP